MKASDYFLLAASFFLLNMSDALMTIWLINAQIAYEVNPLMGILLDYSPWHVFFTSKMIVGTVFAVSMLWCRKREPELVAWALIISVIVYNLVMLKHCYVLAKNFGIL